MGSCKVISLAILALIGSLYHSCSPAQVKAEADSGTVDAPALPVELIRNEAMQKVDILVGDEHFTSYLYTENLKKPVLYPIKTANGSLITRGFPLENRPFERTDHPHHVGLWLNYGDVNGLDFWNNSDNVPENKKSRYGSVVHRDIVLTENGKTQGKLVVTADWVDSQGDVLLKEETTYIFQGSEGKRTIDRTTTLTAHKEEISFKDNKEGMLGLRVARELEHPSNKAEKYTDAQSQPTESPTVNKEGVTGMYKGSNGIIGEKAWGTRAEWMTLSGEINGEKITVAILDHPDNVGYPTYWHVRGYGLFAANPLGQKALSDGKEELSFQLKAGESATFEYRIIVYSGKTIPNLPVQTDFKEFAGSVN